MLYLALGILGALGVFVAVTSLLGSRQTEIEVAHAGGGGRRFGEPATMRDRLERPFSKLAEGASRRGSRRGRPTLAEQLGQAGLTLRTSEFVMMRFGCAALLALIGLLRFGIGLQPVVMAVLGYFIPGLYLRYRQSRRRRAFQQQLVDTITLLSSALKAGHSFPQALDTVAKNGNPPISEEFDRVVREMNIGGSAEQALQKLVRRVESEDLDLIVTAVLIHSTVGGNLSRILDAISHTIRERIRVRGEISAITAQARASGWIITLLPVAVAGLLYFIAPGYFRPMTEQLLGWLMLVFCGVSIFIGNLIIRRITRIRV
jgi:tight adherence protein B